MKLELFLITVKEYKRFAKQLPINSKSNETFDESIYVAIQTRLMLIRKYTSKNDSVYIVDLIKEAKERFPNEEESFDDIQTRFSNIYNQSFEQILSDGTKLNLYSSIEDMMYGLYLHADEKKILHLSCANESLRFYYTKKYVEEVETIIFKLFNILKQLDINEINEMNHKRAPVIYLGDSNKSSQNIKKSPYWENLYGNDATDDELNKLNQELSVEECQILLYASSFLKELKKEKVSVKVLQGIVFKSTLKQWGDFSEAISLYKKINNPGISNMVRFSEERDFAHVHIFPQVEEGFIISTPHIVSDVYDVTLIKDKRNNEWKVFAFGAPVDPDFIK